MTTETHPKCDSCDAPATHRAVDILRIEDPRQMFVKSKPIGGMKYGCDAHPVESETFRSNPMIGGAREDDEA